MKHIFECESPSCSSSSSRSASDESEWSESGIEGDKLRRSVRGIVVVKHLENIPFSSTLCAFLNLDEISTPLSTKASRKFRQGMETEVQTLITTHLVKKYGLFEWEKERLGIGSGDVRTKASFTPTYDLHNKLKCLLHLQIKLKGKRFQKEVGAMHLVMLGTLLPTHERILRKNFLIDLAMILQHQVVVSIMRIQQGKQARIEPNSVPQSSLSPSTSTGSLTRGDPTRMFLPGWKSLLTVRDVSFEEISDDGFLHSCVILPFDVARKGFALLRKDQDKLIPLLWAQPKIGLGLSGFDVYEAKVEKNLLGIVKLNSFGSSDGKVFERFKYGDVEFLKEVLAINYPNVLRKKTGREFRILLSRRHWEIKEAMEDESCVEDILSKSTSLRRKWKELGSVVDSSSTQIDFHILKIRKPSSLGCLNEEKGKKTPGKIQMEVQDESGDILLRIWKEAGLKYSLEYRRPFDAFTAFTSALSQF